MCLSWREQEENRYDKQKKRVKVRKGERRQNKIKETAKSEKTKNSRKRGRQRESKRKSGAVCVWPLFHDPPNNTGNLLTTGVHLAWSDYNRGSELDSAPPFPLATRCKTHKHIHIQSQKQTQVHNIFTEKGICSLFAKVMYVHPLIHLVFFCCWAPITKFTRREYKMERYAEAESFCPPRKSAVNPRNNTGEKRRASGRKRGEKE